MPFKRKTGLKITGGFVIAAGLIVLAWRLLQPPAPVQPAASALPDKYGCYAPSSDVIAKVGVNLSVDTLKYADVALGKVNVKTDPGIVDLLGRVSRDATVRDYLRCLAFARDKFTPEQVAYLDRFNAYVAAGPTPDQLAEWQRQNPFPRQVVITRPVVVACSHLNVTAEWQGVDAPEQTQSCSYSAPPNCRIVSPSTQTHSDNNGSSAVSVSPDSRSLSATVKARPHGSFLDRKRGWIDISVSAELACES